jgi:hypothetical protein
MGPSYREKVKISIYFLKWPGYFWEW